MTVFEELKRRGLLAQLTDEEEIKELINAGKATSTSALTRPLIHSTLVTLWHFAL